MNRYSFDDLGGSTVSDCPLCQLSMQNQEYEGVMTQFCGTCWGHWLDDEALRHILETEVYAFHSERKSVFEAWAVEIDSPESVGERAKLKCPVCTCEMQRAPFDKTCSVVVDRCDEHGTWLDVGEIKQLQVFVEDRK